MEEETFVLYNYRGYSQSQEEFYTFSVNTHRSATVCSFWGGGIRLTGLLIYPRFNVKLDPAKLLSGLESDLSQLNSSTEETSQTRDSVYVPLASSRTRRSIDYTSSGDSVSTTLPWTLSSGAHLLWRLHPVLAVRLSFWLSSNELCLSQSSSPAI